MKQRAKNWLLPLMVFVGLLTTTATTDAGLIVGPLPYRSFADSPFSGGSFSYFYLENFEDGALNTPGVSASSGGVLAPGPFTDSVDGDDGLIDGSGLTGHSWYSQNLTSNFTFTFSAVTLGTLPTHAGIVWTDVAAVSSGNLFFGSVSFEAFGPTGVSLGNIGPFLLGDGASRGQTAEDRFFGVVDSGGISRITIRTANSTDWEVDHLQYGASSVTVVPEPASLVSLGIIGSLVMIAFGQGRNRKGIRDNTSGVDRVNNSIL